MTIFVDASALIAMIVSEPDGPDLADRLEADPDRLCSAMSLWETVAGLCKSYCFTPLVAREEVQLFLAAASIRMVTIASRESELAFEAFMQLGRGRHPAGLNMGDCFAYACAKANDARLLYKGNDFAKTDLA